MDVHTGALGLAWVAFTHIDRTAVVERLVVELPTATVPRKELITRSVREGRWNEGGGTSTSTRRSLHQIASSSRRHGDRRPPDRGGDVQQQWWPQRGSNPCLSHDRVFASERGKLRAV